MRFLSLNRLYLFMIRKSYLVFLLIGLACIHNSYSANRYWVSSGSSNWNNSNNWAVSSNGAKGATVPTIGDIACFVANNVGNCSIDMTVSVDGFLISGYTGIKNPST